MMNLILIMLFVLMSSLSVSSVSISTSELLALLETVFVNVVDVVDDIRSTDTDIYHLSEQQQSQSKSSFYYDYIVSIDTISLSSSVMKMKQKNTCSSKSSAALKMVVIDSGFCMKIHSATTNFVLLSSNWHLSRSDYRLPRWPQHSDFLVFWPKKEFVKTSSLQPTSWLIVYTSSLTTTNQWINVSMIRSSYFEKPWLFGVWSFNNICFMFYLLLFFICETNQVLFHLFFKSKSNKWQI